MHQIKPEEKPSYAVVRVVAAVTNTPTEEMPPLFDSIDPEALDTFVRTSEEGRLSFRYDGVKITIADGTVFIDDEDDDSPK